MKEVRERVGGGDRDGERESGVRGGGRCAEDGDIFFSKMYTQTAESIHWNNNVLTENTVQGRGYSWSDMNGSERRGESAHICELGTMGMFDASCGERNGNIGLYVHRNH